MIIKPTKTKEKELIKQRMKNLLDSGREIDTEVFAKNIGVEVSIIDNIAEELLSEDPINYEKKTATVKK